MSSYPIAHKFPDFFIVDPPLRREILIDSSFSTLKVRLPTRRDTALSVLPDTRRFRGEPFNGGDERAVEGETLGKVSGSLIDDIRTGQGARKNIQHIFKLRCRRFGTTSYVRRHGL